MDARKDRALGAFIGLAVGDALGTTLEFKPRDSYRPLTDMVGGGPFGLEPGQWTDDTSMALCLADALIAGRGEFDRAALLDRFVAWWQDGENASNGECFDIGNATASALRSYMKFGTLRNNGEPHLQANGSIMRLSPVVLCARSRDHAIELAVAQGETTHAAPVPAMCCATMASLLWELVEHGDPTALPAALRQRSRDSIASSGHAPATLDAATWAVATTTDFRAATLRAVNLGDDADTVGAVAGQIAGALYGLSAIPGEWVARLALRTHLIEKAEQLYALGPGK